MTDKNKLAFSEVWALLDFKGDNNLWISCIKQFFIFDAYSMELFQDKKMSISACDELHTGYRGYCLIVHHLWLVTCCMLGEGLFVSRLLIGCFTCLEDGLLAVLQKPGKKGGIKRGGKGKKMLALETVMKYK